MSTIDSIRADLDALKVAHDANVSARLATITAKDNQTTVTLAAQAKIDAANVDYSKATFESKAASEVAATTEAVSAALLATGLERLHASINDYAQQAQQDQRTLEFSRNTSLADFAQQARLDNPGNPTNPGYNQGQYNPNAQPGYNPNHPQYSPNPNHPNNPGNPSYNPANPGVPLTAEQIASGDYANVDDQGRQLPPGTPTPEVAAARARRGAQVPK